MTVDYACFLGCSVFLINNVDVTSCDEMLLFLLLLLLLLLGFYKVLRARTRTATAAKWYTKSSGWDV